MTSCKDRKTGGPVTGVEKKRKKKAAVSGGFLWPPMLHKKLPGMWKYDEKLSMKIGTLKSSEIHPGKPKM